MKDGEGGHWAAEWLSGGGLANGGRPLIVWGRLESAAEERRRAATGERERELGASGRLGALQRAGRPPATLRAAEAEFQFEFEFDLLGRLGGETGGGCYCCVGWAGRLKAGSWELATGNWQLASGSWQVVAVVGCPQRRSSRGAHNGGLDCEAKF